VFRCKNKDAFYLAICHLLARLVKKIDGITKTGEVFAKYLVTYFKKGSALTTFS
jgi:hypothetical protein